MLDPLQEGTYSYRTKNLHEKSDAHPQMLIIFIQFSECDVNDDWGLDLPLATIWVFVGFILCIALLIVLFF